MATAVPTPPSPDTLHTPISSESIVTDREFNDIAIISSAAPSSSHQLYHQQQQPQFQFQQRPRQEQTRQDASRQTKRMSTASVDAVSGTGAGTGTGGEKQKRKSRTSIGTVSVVKIEPISTSASRRQSASQHSLKKSRSKSRSPPRRVSAGGIEKELEIEMDIGHHTQEMTFELDGRRVSVSSVTGLGGNTGGNGSVSTGAVTPKDRLPPSPPLTRVGSDDSIRLSSGKRSRRTSKRKSVDAKPAGGVNSEAQSNAELHASGDISLQDVRAYQQEDVDDKPHGSHSQIEDDNRKLIQSQSQSAEDSTGPHSAVHPFGADQLALATSSRPSSPAPPNPISAAQPGDVRHVLDHPMYSSYETVGPASSSVPRPLPLRSRASEAKLTGQLSPLPSPTRNHPLYRPPSPQPWDIVQPPPGNNLGMNGNGIFDGTFANGTGRSGRTGTTGTLDGREGSLKSEVLVAEKDVVVRECVLLCPSLRLLFFIYQEARPQFYDHTDITIFR